MAGSIDLGGTTLTTRNVPPGDPEPLAAPTATQTPPPVAARPTGAPPTGIGGWGLSVSTLIFVSASVP